MIKPQRLPLNRSNSGSTVATLPKPLLETERWRPREVDSRVSRSISGGDGDEGAGSGVVAGKLIEIANFNEKSRKTHGKNPKDTWRTRQNLVNIYGRSVKIAENQPKVEKSHKNHQQNFQPTI